MHGWHDGQTRGKTRRATARLALLALALVLAALPGPRPSADPWLGPGDAALRSDLHTLADAGVLRAPLTTWPLPWADVAGDLRESDPDLLASAAHAAYDRVLSRAALETRPGFRAQTHLGLAERPRVIRTFDDTPREEAQLAGGLSWAGDRLMVRLSAARVWDPVDGDRIRLDGSHASALLGNWVVSVGYPERWWGPGWDGSLILSNNARPTPQLSVGRARSAPFEARWLRWLGPWSFDTFMGLLDDDRELEEALLFGARFVFRPVPRLEVGLSRTAQWCGDGRPCDAEAFLNLMVGRSNRGTNVPAEREPGNQLAGFDLRWGPLPNGPAAIYLQWIGEDTRQGGPQVGSWLRQLGLELAGATSTGRWLHRTHVEASETICRDGALGLSSQQVRCAYEHSIYRTGYRYRGRAIGHGMDGDGRAYAVGTTLVSTEQRVWRLSLRHIEINRTDAWHNPGHTLAAGPRELSEITVMHSRPLAVGTLRAAAGYSRLRGLQAPAFNDRSLFGWLEFVIH